MRSLVKWANYLRDRCEGPFDCPPFWRQPCMGFGSIANCGVMLLARNAPHGCTRVVRAGCRPSTSVYRAPERYRPTD